MSSYFLYFSSAFCRVLRLLPFSDWFISQITYGHHKQPQALLSISYTSLPPGLFALSLSTVCHYLSLSLCFLYCTCTVNLCLPVPVNISQSLLVPYVFRLWRGRRGEGMGEGGVYPLGSASAPCNGLTSAPKEPQSAWPGTSITSFLKSKDRLDPYSRSGRE